MYATSSRVNIKGGTMTAAVWTVSLIVVNLAVCWGRVEDESYLQSYLLVNYSSNVRPNQQVDVELSMVLNNVIELDIVDQVMIVSGSIFVTWSDSRLVWDEREYHGTKELYFTVDEVWRPLLVLRNAADEIMALGDKDSQRYIRIVTHHNGDMSGTAPVFFKALCKSSISFNHADEIMALGDKASQRSIRIVAHHNGDMSWAAPAFFKALCSVDVSMFPFDTQTCELEVSSWMFANDRVNFSTPSDDINLGSYEANGEYNLVRTYVDIRNEEVFGTTPWSLVVFGLELQRRNSYYVMNIVLPVLFLQVLGVVVFAVPAASGEKLSYALTLLLSLVVMTTLVAENIPSTSMQVPVISIFVLEGVIMSVLELVFTVYILQLHRWHEENQKPGPAHCLLGTILVTKRFRSSRNKIHGYRIHSKEDPSVEMTIQDVTSEKALPAFESHGVQTCDDNKMTSPPTAPQEVSTSRDATISFKEIADALEKACFVVFSLLTAVFITYASISVATG